MKPRILALYYSQTGQMRQILESIVSRIREEAAVDFVAIEPVTPYPFPWQALQFFDAMPETVQQLPIPMKPLPEEIINRSYDLVLFGYQPWFLHPSLPVTSFLQSPSAHVLSGKKVVTVIGARNMWLHAQEKVKESLQALNAQLCGNIALIDNKPNLVSTLTVIRWAFKGQKERSGLLPAAGVQKEDVLHAALYGPTILHYLQGKEKDLNGALLAQGAVVIKPGLVLLEKKGTKNFRKWAAFIREKGGPGAPERAGRVKLFKNLLIVAIFILSPITGLTAFVQRQLQHRRLKKEVAYFKSLDLVPGKL